MRTFFAFVFVLILAVVVVRAQEQTLYQQGLQALQAKEYSKAKDLLQQAIAIGADSAYAWYALGVAANGAGDYPLMLKAGKRLADLAPNRGGGLYLQVGAYDGLEQHDSVAIVSKQLLMVDPTLAAKVNIIPILKSYSQDAVGELDSVFATPDSQISISLPASWTTNHVDDGKTLNWFISLQPIVEPTDAFSTGVTIRWVRRLLKTFPKLEGSTDVPYMVGFWRGYLKAQIDTKPFYQKDVSSSELHIGTWGGNGIVQDLQVDEKIFRLRKFDIVLSRNDEVISVMLECPIELWPIYEPRFKKALASLKLPK